MTDKHDDELSTKRDMVRLLAKDATGEQLDAAIHACIDSRLNDAERRTVLIETIYRSWRERADFAPAWEDVRRMFLDIHEAVGVPQLPRQPSASEEKSEFQGMATPIARLSIGAPQPPPQPTSSDEKSELQQMAVPIARLPPGVAPHEASDDSMVLGHIQRALDEPPSKPPSPDEKSEYPDVATPLRARLSLNWARARPIR
jgi:hypothetical protein